MADLRATLNDAVAGELDVSLNRIAHCVNQLTDEQVWSRARPDLNSIGNLILHLAGNVRQMIVNNLTDMPDDRDRPAEFNTRDVIPKAELLQRLTDTVNAAKMAIREAHDDVLCEQRQINKNDWTSLDGIVRSTSHFHGHAQEIIYMTRMMLGDKYQFAGPR